MSGNRKTIATWTYIGSFDTAKAGNLESLWTGKYVPLGVRTGAHCTLSGTDLRIGNVCLSDMSQLHRRMLLGWNGRTYQQLVELNCPYGICPITTQYHGKTLDPSNWMLYNKILPLQRLRIQYPMPDSTLEAGDTAGNELEPIS